jgi:hypothetical protein
MGAFLGCCVIAAVVGYWLRRCARGLAVLCAIHEAALNRAATNRGDRPISEDIDTTRIF